jgi:hypothetical protein
MEKSVFLLTHDLRREHSLVRYNLSLLNLQKDITILMELLIVREGKMKKMQN